MKVLLIDPSKNNGIKLYYESLGIAYLKSNLPKNEFDVNILSQHLMNLNCSQLMGIISYFDPDILGFSLMEIDAIRILEFIRKLRKEGYTGHITLGQHFPTFNHRQILEDYPEVDSVVRGEGELTFNELAMNLKYGESLEYVKGVTFRRNGEVVENQPRELIKSLDTLNWPARDFTEKVINFGGRIMMTATRGCYANCSFCSIAGFYKNNPGKKWRMRSHIDIVDELEYLHKKYPCAPFIFDDDQFIGPGENGKRFAFNLADEILRRNLNISYAIPCRVNNIDSGLFSFMKNSGLKEVFIGIESGSDENLKRFNKGTTTEINKQALNILDDCGLDYKIGFIFFDNKTSFKDIKKNIEFMEHLKENHNVKKGNLAIVTSLQIHKGTPAYDKYKDNLKGNYKKGFKYRNPNLFIHFIQKISEFIFDNFIIWLTKRRYTPKKFLNRNLNINHKNEILGGEKNEKSSKDIEVGLCKY